MWRRKIVKDQKGSAAVEAIFILPITILLVVMLLFLSLFIYQRANLQAALETCLVYYKNSVTDTYVEKSGSVTYSSGGEEVGVGNSYSAGEPLSPYRGMFGDSQDLNSQSGFESYFKSITRGMLFNKNLSLTIKYQNGLVADKFQATATQTVKFPLDLTLIGIKDGEYKLTAASRVAVIDHDNLIRNADYAISLVKRTKIGEYAETISSKVQEAYGKFKEILGAK